MAVTANGLGINDIFNGQSDLTSALENGRQEIRNKVREKKVGVNIKELESKLKTYFNGLNGGLAQFNPNEFLNYCGDEVGKIWVEMGNNFDLENFKVTKRDMEYSNITVNRINNAISQAKSTIEKLNRDCREVLQSTNISQLSGILEKIDGLIIQANNILEAAVPSQKALGNLGKVDVIAKEGTNIMSVIAQLEGFNNFFSEPSHQRIIAICAKKFEEALVQAARQSFSNSIDETIDESLNSLNVRTGDISVFRGVDEVKLSVTFDSLDSLIPGIEGKLKDDVKRKMGNKYTEGKTGNFEIIDSTDVSKVTIKYSYNPGENKSGKMDASLSFNGKPVRASAKNWPIAYSKGLGDLGGTTIDAAITRSGGSSVAEAYKLATNSRESQNLELAHNVAKMAIKADIAMGLSQGSDKGQHGAGYANVLVVNTGSEIRVINLVSLVLDEKTNVENYNEQEIVGEMANRFDMLKGIKENRTDIYLLLATSYLNSIRVTIKPNIE